MNDFLPFGSAQAAPFFTRAFLFFFVDEAAAVGAVGVEVTLRQIAMASCWRIVLPVLHGKKGGSRCSKSLWYLKNSVELVQDH
jgi:hypothetical protein